MDKVKESIVEYIEEKRNQRDDASLHSVDHFMESSNTDEVTASAVAESAVEINDNNDDIGMNPLELEVLQLRNTLRIVLELCQKGQAE